MTTGIKDLFMKAYRDAENASMLHIDPEKVGRAGFKVMVVCVSAALCLTASYYLSYSSPALHWLVGWLGGAEWIRWIDHKDNRQLSRLVWWVGVVVLFYWVVPSLIVKCVLREKLSSYGLRVRGAFADFRIYLIAMMIVAPLVWFFSADRSFLARYPFFSPRAGEGLWPTFLLWETVYLLQFAAIEFFFRGFLLHGTRERFGFYSVFVMTIPYCMIHFAKPVPETLAAVVAGIVLGVFSLKSGSIVPGFLLHCGTALGMDFAALLRKGMPGL